MFGLCAAAHARQSGLQDIAERYVHEILEVQPAGPHIIVGECDGGALAYEVAQQLRVVCLQPPLLVLVDSFAPGGPRLRPFVPRVAYRVVDLTRLVGFHLRVLAALDWRAKPRYLMPRIGRLLGRVRSRILRHAGVGPPEAAWPRTFRAALDDYVPVAYDGRALLFRGRKLPWGVENGRTLGWGSLMPQLAVCELPAYFGTTLLELNVRMLAEHMERVIEAG